MLPALALALRIAAVVAAVAVDSVDAVAAVVAAVALLLLLLGKRTGRPTAAGAEDTAATCCSCRGLPLISLTLFSVDFFKFAVCSHQMCVSRELYWAIGREGKCKCCQGDPNV